jgi:hypothetical protein
MTTTTTTAATAATTAAAPAAPAGSAPSSLDGEKAELLASLAVARAALVASVSGLDDRQAGERPTVSSLCLGGLLKHVAAMEELWMRFALEGTAGMSRELPEGVTWDDLMAGTAREIPQWMIDYEADFTMAPGETLAGIVARLEQVAARTEEIIASVPDLSVSHPLPEAPWHPVGEQRSIRRVLLHLIAETAQHAGHADILRETLNARTAA